jgi:hypothetical protein
LTLLAASGKVMLKTITKDTKLLHQLLSQLRLFFVVVFFPYMFRVYFSFSSTEVDFNEFKNWGRLDNPRQPRQCGVTW